MKSVLWLSAAVGAAVLAACASSTKSIDGPITPPMDTSVSRTEHVSWDVAVTPLDRTAQELGQSSANHISRARVIHAQIVAVDGPRTIENTLVPLNELYMHIDAVGEEAGLFQSVSNDEATREMARGISQELSTFVTELSLDRRMYDAIAAVDLTNADAATKFAVEKELRDYRRAGVDQSQEVRERISVLNEELVKLSQTFRRNIDEDVREVEFEPNALEGLPDDYVLAHPVNADGKVVINTTYPDYRPFMKYAESPEARERMYLTYMNRGYPANMGVLEEVMAKRYEKATLLGYDNWADYATEDKMIGSAGNASAFIDKVAAVSRDAAARDYAMLLARKQQDDPDAGQVYDWEKTYYSDRVLSENFAYDSQAMRAYFNFDDVLTGILELTSRMFGIRYVQLEGLELWNDDVSAWDVYDGDEHIGRFYLDLHPRDNKYGHAACFGYRAGIAGERLPQKVLVCNFPSPAETENGVALMEFGAVETFFHEFGHLLHGIFAGHRPWMMNADISTEWDFVEAPSQMLEEWLFDAETLQQFAKHYETGEPIPAEMVETLRAASEFGKGMNTAHQMFYAKLSLSLYDRDPDGVDTTELVMALQPQYSPFAYVDDTHFQCSFGHLMGYSAFYYTYMWSQVIAKDMFSRFAAEGVLNEETAASYREAVLAPGGSKPAAELVEDFLGREYAFDAFQEWLETQS